jgi:hypothetical protein
MPIVSSETAKDSAVGNDDETEDSKYDVEHEIQGLIDTMEGADRRSVRDSSSMRVDEVREQDIRLTSRLVDNEDQLLAEANFRAASERKSYCFSRKCFWHFVLLSLMVVLIVVGALLIANANSKAAENSSSAAAGSPIPPAPSNLADICSFSVISSGNTADCRTACEPAACCYRQDSTTIPSCYNNYTVLCASYIPCISLEAPQAPTSTDTINLPVPMETPPPVPIETPPPVPMETSPPVAVQENTIRSVDPPPENLSTVCDVSSIQAVSPNFIMLLFLFWS